MFNIIDTKKNITLVEHLQEVRNRIIISILGLIITFIVIFYNIGSIMDFILVYADNIDLIYIDPAELLMSYVRVSFILAVVFTAPLILFQIWIFVKPGLKKKEKVALSIILFFGFGFFILGGFLAFKFLLPMIIQFLLGYRFNDIVPMFTIDSYLNFVISNVIMFGIIFELPLLVSIFTWFGFVSPKILENLRKYVVLIIFIIAAIITPPDVISQIIVSIPLLLLFELSVLLSKLIFKGKGKYNG